MKEAIEAYLLIPRFTQLILKAFILQQIIVKRAHIQVCVDILTEHAVEPLVKTSMELHGGVGAQVYTSKATSGGNFLVSKN